MLKHFTNLIRVLIFSSNHIRWEEFEKEDYIVEDNLLGTAAALFGIIINTPIVVK